MQIPLVALSVIVIVTFPLHFHPMRCICEDLLITGSNSSLLGTKSHIRLLLPS